MEGEDSLRPDASAEEIDRFYGGALVYLMYVNQHVKAKEVTVVENEDRSMLWQSAVDITDEDIDAALIDSDPANSFTLAARMYRAHMIGHWILTGQDLKASKTFKFATEEEQAAAFTLAETYLTSQKHEREPRDAKHLIAQRSVRDLLRSEVVPVKDSAYVMSDDGLLWHFVVDVTGDHYDQAVGSVIPDMYRERVIGYWIVSGIDSKLMKSVRFDSEEQQLDGFEVLKQQLNEGKW